MARLFDRVVAGEARPMSPGAVLAPEAMDALPRLPVIVADNVSEFYFAVNPQETWDYERDFPNLAPPFPAFWIEARRPSRIVSETVGVLSSRLMPPAWGAFVVVEENSGPGGWRWMINAYLWIDPPRAVGESLAGPCGGLVLFVDPQGRATRVDGDAAARVMALKDEAGDPTLIFGDEQVHSDFVTTLMDPLILALSFMHCRNVETRQVEQPAKLSRKWEQKHGRPLVRYHVLDIDPIRKVLRDEGGIEEGGLKRALHICRGHFATYTEDAPLFGRVTGTFWRPQHVRGSTEAGAVVKDYRVRAPR